MDRRQFGKSQPGGRVRLVVGAVAAVSLLLGTGCSPTADSTPSADPGLAVDPTSAAAVPPQYRQDGVLLIANDPSYPPMEFIASGNRVGADIDLANAIAAVVGLRTEFADQAFSTIVPSVGIGRYELGLSSLWAERSVGPRWPNMTTYFQAGTQFAVRPPVEDRVLPGWGFAATQCQSRRGPRSLTCWLTNPKRAERRIRNRSGLLPERANRSPINF